MKVDLQRVGDWYHGYIQLVDGPELRTAFEQRSLEFSHFLDSIPAQKLDFAYAEAKWTVREVLQHIIDAERVFAYRALRIGRMDTTPLPGFDENAFASNAHAANRDWNGLCTEFQAVRLSTRLLFQSFSDAQLQANGITSGAPTYTLAFGYIILGHAAHHQRILSERYL